MCGNPSLRHELDLAAKSTTEKEYRAKLEEITNRFSVPIKVVKTGGINRFNCYAYALGAWDDPRYMRLVDEKCSSVLIDSGFVIWLLQKGELVGISEHSVQLNDVALYFKGGRPKHAGRVQGLTSGLMIISKWGPHEVHEHRPWDVPAEYGDQLRFFRRPDPGVILNRLVEHLKDPN